MSAQRRCVVAVHAALALVFFLASAWMMWRWLGEPPGPEDEPWPVSSAIVFVPVALFLAGIGLLILAALWDWALSARPGRLAIIDLGVVFVMALLLVGPIEANLAWVGTMLIAVLAAGLVFGVPRSNKPSEAADDIVL